MLKLICVLPNIVQSKCAEIFKHFFTLRNFYNVSITDRIVPHSFEKFPHFSEHFSKAFWHFSNVVLQRVCHYFMYHPFAFFFSCVNLNGQFLSILQMLVVWLSFYVARPHTSITSSTIFFVSVAALTTVKWTNWLWNSNSFFVIGFFLLDHAQNTKGFQMHMKI